MLTCFLKLNECLVCLQEMRVEALKLAQEYNNTVRAKYMDAAERLRMPYWDWIGDHACQNGRHLQKQAT